MGNQYSGGDGYNETITGLWLAGRAEALKMSTVELVKRVDSRPNSFREYSVQSVHETELWSRAGLIQILPFSRNIYDHSGMYLLLRHQRTMASSFPPGSDQWFQGTFPAILIACRPTDRSTFVQFYIVGYSSLWSQHMNSATFWWA